MNRLFRRCVAASCLAITSFGASAVLVSAPYASAQEFPDPDDFIDPVTGEFDLDAYLAALSAGQESGGEPLPRTGSDIDAAVAAGLGLVAVGGAVALAGRRRRDVSQANVG